MWYNVCMHRIYHNHIPRTGGNFVRDILTNKMFVVSNPTVHIRHPDYQFKELKKEEIINADIISGHFGIEPEMLLGKENLYSITTLRNPIVRLVSHFTANMEFVFQKNPVYSDDIYAIGEPNTEKALKMFKKWIRNSEDMLSKSNFQSRWLLNGLNNNLKPVTAKDAVDENQLILLTTRDGWGVGIKEPSYDETLEKINNMFCVGTTEKIKDFFLNFDKKIYDNFNLILPEIVLEPKEYALTSTLNLYNALSSEDIDIIKELNQIDLKIWENQNNK